MRFKFKHLDVVFSQDDVNAFSSQFNCENKAPEPFSLDWEEAFVDMIYTNHDPAGVLGQDMEWQHLDIRTAISEV